MDTPRIALLAAIEVAGSQTRLAELLTERLTGQRVITQAHVATWVRRGRAAGDMCGQIEAITGVPRVELRPDLFYEVS